MDLAYPVAGFMVGTIVGLTGVGGGSLMTPLIILLFGVSPTTAIGTDLVYAAITKSMGAWMHARRGTVDWTSIAWLASGSIPAALVTPLMLDRLGLEGHVVTEVLTMSLGVALILTAVALLFKQRLLRAAWKFADDGVADRASTRRRYATVLAGAILGALVSLSSVGAGALGAVALNVLYPRMTTARVIGTDITHAVPLTLVAGSVYALTGSVNWALLGGLLVGSIPGIYLGSLAASRVPERFLRSALASCLLLVGFKFVL